MITKYVKQIIEEKKNFLTVLPIFTPSLYTNAFKALKTTNKIPPKCLVENQNIGPFE